MDGADIEEAGDIASRSKSKNANSLYTSLRRLMFTGYRTFWFDNIGI